MLKEITGSSKVFSDNGNVDISGYSKHPLFIYNKDKSTASYFRTRESDAYYIKCQDMALFISIENAGIIGTITAVLWDNKNHKQYSRTIRKFLPYLRFKMPTDVNFGDTSYTDSRVGMKFSKSGDARHIRADFIDFQDSMHLYINLTLKESNTESLNICSNYKNSKTSYYLKSVIPNMTAQGVIKCGGAEFHLSHSNSNACLLWSRISSAEKSSPETLYCFGKYCDKNALLVLSEEFGGNIDQSCIIINGKMQKLPPVKKIYDEDLKCYKYKGKNGYLELNFIPQSLGGVLFEANCLTKSVSVGNVFGNIIFNGEKIIIDDYHTLQEKIFL
ncbi:MAG: DUF2804 family protein [Acutalibacteraceae bacterium]